MSRAGFCGPTITRWRSMKEAAHILSVTRSTVAFHTYRMMAQFGVRSRAELIQFAVRRGVVAS